MSGPGSGWMDEMDSDWAPFLGRPVAYTMTFSTGEVRHKLGWYTIGDGWVQTRDRYYRHEGYIALGRGVFVDIINDDVETVHAADDSSS